MALLIAMHIEAHQEYENFLNPFPVQLSLQGITSWTTVGELILVTITKCGFLFGRWALSCIAFKTKMLESKSSLHIERLTNYNDNILWSSYTSLITKLIKSFFKCEKKTRENRTKVLWSSYLTMCSNLIPCTFLCVFIF